MSQQQWPTECEELHFHQQLLAESRTIWNEIAERYLPLLAGDFQKRFPHLHPDTVTTAVIDAIFNYLRKPESYDPAKLTLGAYLRMSARGDLSNATRVRACDRNTITLESVADVPQLGNTQYTFDMGEDNPRAKVVYETLSPQERAAFDLMCEGYRETRVYAEAMGLLELSREEQETEVKRTKDRIQKKFKRELEKLT